MAVSSFQCPTISSIPTFQCRSDPDLVSSPIGGSSRRRFNATAGIASSFTGDGRMSSMILRFPPNFVRQLSIKARRNCSNIGVAQIVAAKWSNNPDSGLPSAAAAAASSASAAASAPAAAVPPVALNGVDEEVVVAEEGIREEIGSVQLKKDSKPSFLSSDGSLAVHAGERLGRGIVTDAITTPIVNTSAYHFNTTAAFIGVNHHGQFLLLGCGLLLNNESTSGFVWLFRAWLKAMHGCQPRVILTKHDQTIKEAVSEALPGSRHCFYTWDTLGQMPEKLGHVVGQEKGFVDEINEAIYGSCKGDEFEKKWCEVVDRFHVRDNAWLQSLYEDREHWVPVYMKDVSLAGMCTAQRSECVSFVFDKYIQRKTTLRAFLDQYKTMIQERYEEEEKAETETLCKQPGLKSPSPFGKQMVELYTREMFKKFQVEVLGGVACHPQNESDEGQRKTFRVQDYEQKRGFVVVWSPESSEVVCSCRLFEFKGFLCRHAMIVLQMSGELTIPSRYVLKRWTKDARRREAVESNLMCGDSSKAQRYTDLCLRSLKLSEEASLSEESYNAVLNVLNEALRSCENTSNVIHGVEELDSDVAQNPSRHEERNNNNTSFNENVADTRQEHSLLHEVWKETALQEQRNRYSILDDYLSAQQMSHEMGQINMMASTRNGYCTAHQNIHSLGQSITQQRLYGTEQLSFRPEVMYERLQDMGQASFRQHPQQHSDYTKQHQQPNKDFSN